MRNLRVTAGTLSAALIVLSPSVASGQATSTGSGQAYPSKPIRIVTTSPGGGNDFAARIVAAGISGPLGQPVVVVNQSGRAKETVSKSVPDGYTMLIDGGSTWLAPLMQRTQFQTSDFAPISLMVSDTAILAIHPSVPVKSVKELIEYAKSKPGTLNFASTAIGGSAHLSMELFRSMANVNIVHIPYKGSNNALAGLLAGEVQLAIDGVQLLPLIKVGKLRALGVTNAQPTPLAPGLPTIAATGLPGYEWTGRTGIYTHAKTSPAIINRLHQEIVRVLTLPEVKEKFLQSGTEVVASTPEQFAAYIKADTVRMSKVINDAGIKVD